MALSGEREETQPSGPWLEEGKRRKGTGSGEDRPRGVGRTHMSWGTAQWRPALITSRAVICLAWIPEEMVFTHTQ